MTEEKGAEQEKTPDDSAGRDDFLISDFEFFQKGFELWAKHFMGVFYLWTGVVIIPTTAASLLSDLGVGQGERNWLFGLICMGVAILGWYISLKMFDIRRAQLTYAQQMNRIRKEAYKKMGITSRYGLHPYGSDADLKETSKSDFGKYMAVVMSAVHGSLMVIGFSCILLHVWLTPWVLVPGVLLGFLLFQRNYGSYFRMVTNKLSDY